MTPQSVAEPADEPQAALTATCANCRGQIARFNTAAWTGLRTMDEFGRWTAYGHVSGEDMANGMRAYLAEVSGDAMEDGLVPVEHVWAVLKHDDAAADDEGWFFSWKDVTEATPGAFPLTVVPSL